VPQTRIQEMERRLQQDKERVLTPSHSRTLDLLFLPPSLPSPSFPQGLGLPSLQSPFPPIAFFSLHLPFLYIPLRWANFSGTGRHSHENLTRSFPLWISRLHQTKLGIKFALKHNFEIDALYRFDRTIVCKHVNLTYLRTNLRSNPI
jgi:hypothetical protein